VLLCLPDRETLEELLGRLPEIQGDLRHVRRDHEMGPTDRPGEDRSREVFVDHGFHPDELFPTAYDRDAATARRDDDPALAVCQEPTDLVGLDDLEGSGRGDDPAPPAPLVVHHLPALGLLHDDLVFAGVVWPDRFRRIRECGIVRIDEDLGEDARDPAVEAAGIELIPQGLGHQVADLRLALRAAHVERHGRDQVSGFLVLEEDVPDLRAVPVGQDHLVALLHEIGEADARRLDPTALADHVAGFARGHEGVAANGHDELRHPRPPENAALF
jgi:hypothetical protein